MTTAREWTDIELEWANRMRNGANGADILDRAAQELCTGYYPHVPLEMIPGDLFSNHDCEVCHDLWLAVSILDSLQDEIRMEAAK